jgi:hypothetical protein
MDFNIGDLQKLEENIEALSAKKVKCLGIGDLSRELLIKSKSVSKDSLAEIVLCTSAVLLDDGRVLHSAEVKLEEQNSELVNNQRGLLQAQNNLITCQKTNLSAVTETVQSETKTLSEVLQTNCSLNSAS